jgi:hypothetical protein
VFSLATNHSAHKTRSSIAGGLRVLVRRLAEVVFVSVHDDGAANNRVRPVQLHDFVDKRHFRHAVSVGDDVAKVAVVSVVVGRTAVVLA